MKVISKIISVKKLTKESLAQPLSPEKAREWAGRGQFTSPNATEDMPKPKSGVKKYREILENTGAAALFGSNLPKLRKYYIPKLKNIVMIDGKEYFLTHVEESVDKVKGGARHIDGHFEIIGPITRQQNQRINWSLTPPEPKTISYDQYKDQIKRSPQEINEKLSMINEFIDEHNIMVDKQQDKKFGTVTVLPLQIDRAERRIKDRLKELESIREETGKSVEKGEDRTERAISDLAFLREDIMSGRSSTTPQNYAVAVLETKFHSIPTLQELKVELANVHPPFDERTNEILLKYLNQVVDWQIKERREEEIKKGIGKENREQRKESDLPEMKEILIQKIKRLDKLPGKAYDKSQAYYSPETTKTQAYEIEDTSSTDYDELSAVLNSLTSARQTIIDLPTKSNEYLIGAGESRLGQINSFLDNAKIFMKRYVTSPYVPSVTEPGMAEINSKLFSKTTPGLGNALIAVILHHIVISVEEELNRIRGGAVTLSEPVKVPGQVVPAQVPAAQSEHASSTKDKIKRMSELLWMAFENRNKLK